MSAFSILEDHLYIMDHLTGLYAVNMNDFTVEAMDLTKFGLSDFYGLDTGTDNAIHRFDIANETYLMTFFASNSTAPLQMHGVHPLGLNLTAPARVQGTANYVSV